MKVADLNLTSLTDLCVDLCSPTIAPPAASLCAKKASEMICKSRCKSSSSETAWSFWPLQRIACCDSESRNIASRIIVLFDPVHLFLMRTVWIGARRGPRHAGITASLPTSAKQRAVTVDHLDPAQEPSNYSLRVTVKLIASLRGWVDAIACLSLCPPGHGLGVPGTFPCSIGSRSNDTSLRAFRLPSRVP